MAAAPRLSGPAFGEARRLVRAQARIVDGRIATWCASPRDRDALHDARTSLRRLRVLVRSFQTDLGSLARKRLRRQMRAAFRATSGVRDRDVFAAWLTTLPASPATRHLLCTAETQAASRADAAVERLGTEWRPIRDRLLASKRDLTPPARTRAFGAAAAQAISDEVRDVDGRLASSAVTPADLHAVRIAAKRLRYLLEALAG